MPDEDRFLYPNRGDDAGTAGVSRRLFLAGSLAAGTAATAGRVRPTPETLSNAAANRRLYRELAGGGTTYCIGNCACGHQL
jgi:hypothetical protein